MHCIETVRTAGGPTDLEPIRSRPKRVPDVDSTCRLLIVPLFPGSSKYESLILSHHFRKVHVSVMKRILMIMIMMIIQGLGFGVRVLRFGVQSSGFRIWVLGLS